MIFIAFLLVGVIAGTISGLLGLGGGVIIVPLLKWIYTYLGFPSIYVMHMATGTALASMIFTSIASYLSHAKRGSSVLPILKRYAPGAAVGTVAGAIVADFLHSQILSVIFGILLLLIAIRIFFFRLRKSRGHLPKPLVGNSVFGAIGVISGLTGLGAGSLSIPFLNYCSVNMRRAVTVATALSILVGLVGAVSFMITGANEPGLPKYSVGYLYLPALLGIVLVSPIFARIGAAISHKLPVTILRMIFAVLLLVIGISMLFA